MPALPKNKEARAVKAMASFRMGKILLDAISSLIKTR